MSLFVVFVRKNLLYSCKADAENVHHLPEDKYPLFLPCIVLTARCFCTSVGSGLFNVFQFLWFSWVIRINSSFEKSPQKRELVNTPCPDPHTSCAVGVSSGIVTRVTFDLSVTGEVGGVYYMGWTLFWFYLCTIVHDSCCLLSFKW